MVTLSFDLTRQAKTAYATFSDAVIPVTAQHLQDSQTHVMLIAPEGGVILQEVYGPIELENRQASTLIQSYLIDHKQV